jgi:hypothetical protein
MTQTQMISCMRPRDPDDRARRRELVTDRRGEGW